MNNFSYNFDSSRHQVVNPKGDVIAYGETKADTLHIIMALNELQRTQPHNLAITHLAA